MDVKVTGPVAVVDDDGNVLESISDLLASAGYTSLTFSSARALLDSPALLSISCLISDIRMPDIDGWQLLAMVRSHRPRLPVILITAHETAGDDVAVSSRGERPVRVLKKPFNAYELLSAVEKSLSNTS